LQIENTGTPAGRIFDGIRCTQYRFVVIDADTVRGGFLHRPAFKPLPTHPTSARTLIGLPPLTSSRKEFGRQLLGHS